MRTAVDTSVLFDVLLAEPGTGERSREALRKCYDRGALVASEIVWAEVRAHFGDDKAFRDAMALLGVRFDALTPEAAETAARLWRESRKGKRAAAQRTMADFLVGAHALHHADALLTRDSAFYRRHFLGLRLPMDSEESAEHTRPTTTRRNKATRRT